LVWCQIDALKKCRTLSILKKRLTELPQTLDETYDRILEGIPEEDQDLAISVLQWLVFAKLPLDIHEVAEAIAIDKAGPFNAENRLLDPYSILEICSCLVILDEESINP
jgi:hypothetical protein